MNPSQKIPTTAVVNANSDSGWSLINSEDFSEDEHEKFEGDTTADQIKEPDPIDEMDKAAIVAALDGLGAEYNKNLGVNKLRGILRDSQTNA